MEEIERHLEEEAERINTSYLEDTARIAGPEKSKVEVRQEKEVSVDDIVAEAKEIFSYCKALPEYSFGDDAKIQAEADKIMQAHRQFCQCYPVVVQFMIQEKLFSEKAMRQFVERCRYHPWKTKDDFLEAQADYVALLIKYTSRKRTNTKEVKSSALSVLKKESDQYEKMVKKSEKEFEQQDREYTRLYREEILEVAEAILSMNKN